jgi:hypothetical protein
MLDENNEQQLLLDAFNHLKNWISDFKDLSRKFFSVTFAARPPPRKAPCSFLLLYPHLFLLCSLPIYTSHLLQPTNGYLYSMPPHPKMSKLDGPSANGRLLLLLLLFGVAAD